MLLDVCQRLHPRWFRNSGSRGLLEDAVVDVERLDDKLNSGDCFGYVGDEGVRASWWGGMDKCELKVGERNLESSGVRGNIWALRVFHGIFPEILFWVANRGAWKCDHLCVHWRCMMQVASVGRGRQSAGVMVRRSS